jgi:hypothetical protein
MLMASSAAYLQAAASEARLKDLRPDVHTRGGEYAVRSMFAAAEALAAMAKGPEFVYRLQDRKRWSGVITMVRMSSKGRKWTHARP